VNGLPLRRWLDGATLLLGLLLLWVFVRQTDFHADLDLLVRIGPLPFLIYLAVNVALAILTPGPQFGGEPAQVYLLVRRSRLAAPQAVASVALDRLLELTLNFTFLAGGFSMHCTMGFWEPRWMVG